MTYSYLGYPGPIPEKRVKIGQISGSGLAKKKKKKGREGGEGENGGIVGYSTKGTVVISP